MTVYQQCINPACGKQFGVEEVLHACSTCGELLDVEYDWNKITPPKSLQHFEQFWQNRLPFADGDTLFQRQKGKQIVESPDTAKSMRRTCFAPYGMRGKAFLPELFKVLERLWWRYFILVVFDIE